MNLVKMRNRKVFVCMESLVLLMVFMVSVSAGETDPDWDEPDWVDPITSTADYDLAIVADPVGADVRSNGPSYYSIIELKPATVLWGSGARAGESLFVAVGPGVKSKQAALSLAQLSKGNDRMLWLLRRAVSGTPTAFRVENCKQPVPGDSWDRFLEEYRNKLAKARKYEGMRCTIIPWSRVVADGLPMRVAVILTGPRESEPILKSMLGELGNKEFRALSRDGLPLGHALVIGMSREVRIESEYWGMRTLPMLPQGMDTDVKETVTVVGIANLRVFSVHYPPTVTFPIYLEVILRGVGAEGGLRSEPYPCLLQKAAWKETDREWKSSVMSLKRCMGPVTFPISETDMSQIEHLLKQDQAGIFAPALRCGLAFAPNTKMTREERITTLKGLAEQPYYDFAAECALELARLLREDGKEKDAEQAMTLFRSLCWWERPAGEAGREKLKE